jgi:hypothetical protein
LQSKAPALIRDGGYGDVKKVRDGGAAGAASYSLLSASAVAAGSPHVGSSEPSPLRPSCLALIGDLGALLLPVIPRNLECGGSLNCDRPPGLTVGAVEQCEDLCRQVREGQGRALSTWALLSTKALPA